MLDELGREAWTEAVRHHAFDRARDHVLGVTFTVNKLDRHALLLARRVLDDALDLTVDRERLRAARDEQLEQELGADGEGAASFDEGAAARDVLGVISEESVEALVLDLELDGAARFVATILSGVVGHGFPYTMSQ